MELWEHQYVQATYKCTAVYTCYMGYVLKGMVVKTCQDDVHCSGSVSVIREATLHITHSSSPPHAITCWFRSVKCNITP